MREPILLVVSDRSPMLGKGVLPAAGAPAY